MKKVLFGNLCIASMFFTLFSQVTLATDEVIEVCNTRDVQVTQYYGTARTACGDKTVPYSLAQSTSLVVITDFSVTPSRTCHGSLPFFYITTVSIEECTQTPYEPYVDDGLRYSPGFCNSFTRNGFIAWDAIDATQYHVQEKVGSNWVDRLFANQTSMTYNRGSGRHNIRIRGYNPAESNSVNGYGTWNYFIVEVPSCSSTGNPFDP